MLRYDKTDRGSCPCRRRILRSVGKRAVREPGRKRPPGPGRIEALLGLLPRRDLANVPSFFRQVADRYGPLAAWPFGFHRFHYVSDPALIEELLVTKARSFVKGRGTQRLSRLLGAGLLTSNGAFHLQQRRAIQPAFGRERTVEYATTIVARSEEFASRLEDGQVVPMATGMARLTLTIAADTLLGTSVEDDAAAIGQAMADATAAFPLVLLPFGELLDLVPIVPAIQRFHVARATLDRIIYRIIAERRREPGDRGDLLSRLFAMPDRQVRDEALTLLLAGHETTANALTWTWALLAAHPDVQEAVAAEVNALRDPGPPTPQSIPLLPLTRDVVAEALRLYPPAWVIGRQAVDAVTLGDWKIPVHGLVVTSQYVTQRDPRFWREPDAFRPERWRNGETKGLPDFAYFPFGGGNRVCIGEGFAWTELIIAVACLARRIRFEATAPLPAPVFSVSLRPTGPVNLVVRRR